MLPLEIERRIEQPGLLENQFIQYLQAGNYPIDQSKSIGYEVLTHYLDVSGRTNASFFTGTFVQAQTNIRGSFVRPQGEHFVIYGIRLYQTTFDGAVDTQFISWQKASYVQTNFAGAPLAQPFANCVYSIINNGVQELKNMPFLMHDNTLVTDERGTLLINQPIVWSGNTELSFNIRTNSPANVFAGSPPTDSTLLRVDLVGIGLI